MRSSTAASPGPTSCRLCSPTRLSRAYSRQRSARAPSGLLARIGGGRSPTIPSALPIRPSSRRGCEPGHRRADRSPLSLFSAPLAAQRGGGPAAPESWHQRALAVACRHRRGSAPQVRRGIARAKLVAAYPTPVQLARRPRSPIASWRRADPALDARHSPADARRQAHGRRARLSRICASRDPRRRLSGEAKAVLDEGVAAACSTPISRRSPPRSPPSPRAPRRSAPASPRLRTRALAAGRPARGARRRRRAFRLRPICRGRRALSRRAAEGRGGSPIWSTAGSARRWPSPAGGPRPRRRFARVTGPRADLACFWLVWLARRPA